MRAPIIRLPASGRFEVVEARRWIREDGATASIYGSLPWTSEAERHRWCVQCTGWTIADNSDGTVGCGRVPWKTREEAQAQADTWNREHAERLAHAARLVGGGA